MISRFSLVAVSMVQSLKKWGFFHSFMLKCFLFTFIVYLKRAKFQTLYTRSAFVLIRGVR